MSLHPPGSLQRELDEVRAQAERWRASMYALEEDLLKRNRELAAARTRIGELEAELAESKAAVQHYSQLASEYSSYIPED